MRSIAAKFIIGAAITAIGLFGADNSIGTWKRNIEKSKSSSTNPNPYKSQTTTRTAVDGGVKVTLAGERKDGTPSSGSYTVKYDGKPTPISVTGSSFDTIAVKQIDANTFTSETSKTGGKYHMKGKTVISKDGKTMTLTQKGTGADGKPLSSTVVYDKQ